MTDIPSRSFGSEPKWHCETDSQLLTLFNASFPLPNKNSWTIFRISTKISMRVISLLRMQLTTMGEWQRLPKIGKLIGKIGPPTSNLWEWTLSYRGKDPAHRQESSQDSQPGSEVANLVEEELSKLTQYRRRSRPLVRRSTWCEGSTLSNDRGRKNTSHDCPRR